MFSNIYMYMYVDYIHVMYMCFVCVSASSWE